MLNNGGSTSINPSGNSACQAKDKVQMPLYWRVAYCGEYFASKIMR